MNIRFDAGDVTVLICVGLSCAYGRALGGEASSKVLYVQISRSGM